MGAKMKKTVLLISIAIFILVIAGCGGETEKAKNEFTKNQNAVSQASEEKAQSEKNEEGRDPRCSIVIKEGTLDELMAKYGPKDMSENDIDNIVNGIKWESPEDIPQLGSEYAKKGGTFTYGMTSYPATLRTQGENSNTVFISTLEGFMFESMTGLHPVTLKTIPALADKWSVGDDKMTYYFHVNPDAKWQDGKPVRAFDYVATWDLLTSDALKEPFSQQYWKKFERPVALTENIVMVKAKALEWRLFMSAGGMSIMPEHKIGRITAEEYMTKYQNEMLMGSGPYMFEKAKTNEFIILKRNPDWWGDKEKINKGLYNFNELKFVFYTEASILLEMFKKGVIDIYQVGIARQWHQELTPDKMESIQKNHIIRQRIFTNAPNGLSGYAFNLREKPFNDKRVRMAIIHLFNREKLMEKLFFNEYKYMKSYFPNSIYENPNNKLMKYDRDKAIELLEEAGYYQDSINEDGYITDEDGKVFEISINVIGDDTRVETIFQEELKSVGIKLNLNKVTWPTHLKDLHERNFKMISAGYGGMLFPNPEGSYHSKYADMDNTNNLWGFKNARVDELSTAYNTEFDLDKRIEMVKEIDGILYNEQMTALRWYSNNVRLMFWNKFGMPEFVLSRYSSSPESSAITYWWYDESKNKALDKAISTGGSLPPMPTEVRYWEKYK
ncbi:MAG: hypothetical protein C0601_06670 [Candidatus Muiribacterium halophilum]|uniref:Solute-binding protein family 5 domain-containing protein n=1 Tax=Muiribacterium halophilum TaxID=2053465 RepID=A0A2N5ZGD4_MUIH1|nr:MAG: hypothetical protein C0601_06670 [Candidatus Muirbacterium halophilum]